MTRAFSMMAAALGLLAGTDAWLHAQDTDAVPEPDIPALVEELLSDDVSAQRQAATRLVDVGVNSVAPVAEAAKVDDAKVVTRCFDVLGRLLASSDLKTAEAAESAIEELSESDIDIVGRRARTTLRLKELLRQREALLKAAPRGPAERQEWNAVQNGKSIRLKRADDGSYSGTITETVDGKPQETAIEAASDKELQEKYPDAHQALKKQQAAPGAVPGIRFNGQVIGGGGISTRVSIVNGIRRVEHQSGDEKIEIEDKDGKAIELKHTRTVDGKTKTDVYKADDLDDLKKKHPDAAKLYERAGAGGGPVGGGALQFRVMVPGPALRIGPARAVPLESTPTTPSGPRTIRSEQPGRSIEIQDEDSGRIRVKITRTVDGNPVTEEFSGENLKAFSEEHPEAARLYEQLTGRRAD